MKLAISSPPKIWQPKRAGGALLRTQHELKTRAIIAHRLRQTPSFGALGALAARVGRDAPLQRGRVAAPHA